MKNIKLFDGHCDTALLITENKGSLYENPYATDISRGLKYDRYCQVYAIFAMDGFENKYLAGLKYMSGQFSRYRDSVSLCRSTDDIDRCHSAGKAAALLSAEGAELLGCDENRISEAKRAGISSINITWNYENALSGSNAQGSDKGLTEKGKNFVKKCIENKIAVDVSHISDPGFWDVCRIMDQTGTAFYASHSNSRAVCPHKRNLTDAQFKAMAALGGVAGINMYAEFIGGGRNIDSVMRHIDHFLELGGNRSISIGADFDGCDELPAGVEGLGSMYKLYDEIVKRYGDETADNIFYYNLYNFYKKVL